MSLVSFLRTTDPLAKAPKKRGSQASLAETRGPSSSPSVCDGLSVETRCSKASRRAPAPQDPSLSPLLSASKPPLLPPPAKFKVERCKNLETFGACKFGEFCFFAHGPTELRPREAVGDHYKSRVCRNFFKGGFCPYASRCQYFHPKSESLFADLLGLLAGRGARGGLAEASWPAVEELKRDRLKARLRVFARLASGDF